MKQTAVQWLVEQLADLTFNYIAGFSTKEEYDALSNQVIEQAKEMDMQQKKKDFEKGYECGVGDYIDCENGFDCKSIGFEEYYIKEYGGGQ